ncbi:MAG: enoyl-CoA hydratase/isomerase family protein [Elusimicrobia bacterium]|nr:enoyl-CoA hydratase/isomerase family protein [Elusimicrobiota bacterium]
MSRKFSTIELELEGRILTVRLSRPEVRNAFDAALLKEAAEAFQDADRDPGVRVVVVTGAGGAFCAGADLAWMRKTVDYTREENLADTAAVVKAFGSLHRMSKPTVAAVNGPAIGGGMGFATACDVVVASKEAVFGLSEVRLGVVPACVTPFLLKRTAAGRLRRWMLSGERFDADTALSLGLVDLVVPSAEAMTAAYGIAKGMAAGAPGAQAVVKSLLDKMPEMTLSQALDHSVEVLAKLRTGPEAQKGTRAFLDKKPCSWE